MMVLFTSRSEKKARKSVRRILDSFAERIGNDTWRTVITEEGLLMVKALLRRNATKSTAVACFWIRSRRRSELLWVVGNRSCFNEEGVVPVHTTQKEIIHSEWENVWQYLPLIKALLAVAALLHDWGKASDYFQGKLRGLRKDMDPYRHEWVSCKLLEAIVRVTDSWDDDRKWLRAISEGTLDIKQVENAARGSDDAISEKLPPAAALLTWLILSHHRMPFLKKEDKQYSGCKMAGFRDVLREIHADWGYENLENKEKSRCFQFSNGLLWESVRWNRMLRKWTARLGAETKTLNGVIQAPALRMILCCARLCLMMSDHYVSSEKAKEQRKWSKNILWANMDGKEPRQTLEEHLVGVAAQALKIIHRLPDLQNQMERAGDIRFLRQRGPARFQWQDKAVDAIREYRRKHEEKTAWFVVNAASTGCGKTIANAKIMQALSEDGRSLRYILALGLRSLTLQTGDEYRDRIGLTDDDMAVLIGSSAVRQLHEENRVQENEEDGSSDELGSEALLQEEMTYVDTCDAAQMEFLSLFFNRDSRLDKDGHVAEKNRAFLYKPVLAATIDHMMGAVETTRGGRYMLPMLRLLSSDLVIDEIDDFGKKDLIAIARLVHLAGMMGRNVSLSSATIPPDLAEGMYRAYVSGLAVHNSFFAEPKHCAAMLCDEFRTEISQAGDSPGKYASFHQTFMGKRAARLERQTVRRKGCVVSCECAAGKELTTEEKRAEIKEEYFRRIREAAERMHDRSHVIDKKTGKEVSFGIIRMANIQPCVELSLYLLTRPWLEGYEARILTYHSRQILLLRHEEERYLDRILKRNVAYGEPEKLDDPVLRKHIDGTAAKKILFIVVATPVEEVGRDHDFDWAVIEPSSYRSIIQLAGRVLRHRRMTEDIAAPNIAVMEYNLRGLAGEKQAFVRPGFEERYRMDSHDICQIVDTERLGKCIDAVPRILRNESLNWKHHLIDLEHQAMADFCGKTGNEEDRQGPGSLSGWNEEFWWLTVLPQKYNRFREKGQEEIRLYVMPEADGQRSFYDYESDKIIEMRYDIKEWEEEFATDWSRLWLARDYGKSLLLRAENGGTISEDAALRQEARKFGEILVKEADEGWYYDDQLGLFRRKDIKWIGGNVHGQKER